MVAWYWLLVVAFVTFPAGFCLFCLLTVAQVSSDAEAAHEDADIVINAVEYAKANESPIVRAAREASEVGKPRPEEIEGCRLIIAHGGCLGEERVQCGCKPWEGKTQGWCPLHGQGVCWREVAAARLWLSSHGIDPDAEIEAAR